MQNTDVFALGVVVIGLGFVLWSYRKVHRITAWLIGFGAFVLTVAIAPWRDALAGMFATTTGLVVLTGLTIASIIAFVFEAIAKHKHHRIRTPVIAATLGATLVLAIADANAMLSSLGKSTSHTGSALSTAVATIHSGAAAHAMSKDHRYMVVVLGIAVIVGLVVLGLRFEGKKGRGAPEPTRPAIGGGVIRALTGGGKRR